MLERGRRSLPRLDLSVSNIRRSDIRSSVKGILSGFGNRVEFYLCANSFDVTRRLFCFLQKTITLNLVECANASGLRTATDNSRHSGDRLTLCLNLSGF